jgi:hypothetical protein
MNRPPERYRTWLAGMNLSNTSPKTIARIVARSKAPLAPKKTANGDFVLMAKERIANWVLSPNSARKINEKVVNMIFRSIIFPLSERDFKAKPTRNRSASTLYCCGEQILSPLQAYRVSRPQKGFLS